MLEEVLKKQIYGAVKENNPVVKDILRVVLGQIQLEGSSAALSEERKLNIIRKLIKSNELTLSSMAETSEELWEETWKNNAQRLKEENQILQNLLPQNLGKEDLLKLLEGKVEEIKTAKSDGQAIGVAMKTLKSAQATFENEMVKELVGEIRK